jgi:S-formylglutathione hydrolase
VVCLPDMLDNYGIKHTYAQYEGDHVNRIEEKIEKKMLAFFSENLSFNL